MHRVFAYLAEVAPVTKGWHFPSAPKTFWAKPQQPRKLRAKGMKHNCRFGYLEALLMKGSLHPPKAE